MTLPISARLLRSWSPWWHLLLSITPLCVVFILLPIRDWLMPVGADRSLVGMTVLALLVPGAVGMLLASSLRELRECPFAWNLPELTRRAVRELRLAGAVLFGVSAAFGPLLAAETTASPWFFPTLTGLGFAIAMVGNDPPPALVRVRVALPSLILPGILLFTPEVSRFMAAAPWLWAVGAAVVMFGAIEATDTATARRHRTSAAATRVAIYPGRLGIDDAAAEFMRRVRAPRDGADTFRGVRRGDFDWVRAILHESMGFMRGGWIWQTISMAVGGVIVVGLLLIFIGVVIPMRGSDDAGRVGLEWLASPLSRQRLALTVTLVSMFATMFLFRTPHRPPLAVVRPLSRERTARVIWLATQSQEVLAWAAIFAMLVVVAVAAWFFGSIDARPAVRDALGALTAVFILLPITRWMKLELVDRRDAGRSDRRRRDIEAIWMTCLLVVVLIVASTLLFSFWKAARGTGPVGRVTVVIVSVAAFFALRGAWFAALRNFYLRRDL